MLIHTTESYFVLCLFLLATSLNASDTTTPAPNKIISSTSPCTFDLKKGSISCQINGVSSSKLTPAFTRENIQEQIIAAQSQLEQIMAKTETLTSKKGSLEGQNNINLQFQTELLTLPHQMQPPLTQEQWDAINSTNSGEGEEGDGDSLAQSKTLIFIATLVVTLIVLISIGFEKWHEWLDENVPEVLTPVLKSVFGELTVLGFIGLIMFVTTKVGKHSLDQLVCGGGEGWWTNDEEICPRNRTTGTWNPEMGCPENPLIELTEQAHMILFGVMVLFLIESVVLIQIGMSRMKIMQEYEQECIAATLGHIINHQEISSKKFAKLGCVYHRCTFVALKFPCCCCISKKSDNYKLLATHVNNNNFLEYQATRRGFIKSYNLRAEASGNEDHSLKGDFDFAQYSIRVLADKLGEIVELTPGNWFNIWLVFVIFLGFDFIDLILGKNDMLLIGIAIFSMYMCCIVAMIVKGKVQNIYSHLIHPMHLPANHPLREKAVKSRKSLTEALSLFKAASKWKMKSLKTPLILNGPPPEKGSSLEQSLLENYEQKESKEYYNSKTGRMKDIINKKIRPMKKTTIESSVSDRKEFTTEQNPNTLIPKSPDRQKKKNFDHSEHTLLKAGVVTTGLDNEHSPLYKFHPDGELKDEPPHTHLCFCCLKHKPTLYEDLFWGGKHGIHLLFGYIRTQMVLVALYLGVFIVVLSSAVATFFDRVKDDYSGIQYYGPILLYFVGLLPLLFMLYELSTVIPLLVRITSTEQKIHGDSVNSTLRVMKSRRALRALHNISCFMANIDIMASKCLEAARKSPTFKGLSKQDEQLLMYHCELHMFKPGETIVTQGKTNNKMFIISEGCAEVIIDGEVKALLTEGKEFGKISMMTGRRCNASIVVCEQMICFTLLKNAVKDIIGEDSFKNEEESFVEIAGGERSLTPEHVNRKNSPPQEKKRRSSLLVTEKWNQTKDWIKRGKMVNYKGRKLMGLDLLKDGVVNAWLVDRRGDGVIDAIGFDTTGNGEIDEYNDSCDMRLFQQLCHSDLMGKNTYGHLNPVGVDTTGDGKIDAYMVDTTGDGNFDSVGFDTTGDGCIDSYDTSGDGLPDIVKGSMADIRRKNRSPAVLAQQRKVALIDLFHAIDSGGDGNIDGEEMYTFLVDIFPPSENKRLQDKQIKLMIEGLDEDGDGEVSLVEFLRMMEPVVQSAERVETPKQVACRMFSMLDEDQGGTVSTTEFKNMLHKVGMEMSYDEVRHLFQEYDESHDGCIDVEEFEAMMTHQL